MINYLPRLVYGAGLVLIVALAEWLGSVHFNEDEKKRIFYYCIGLIGMETVRSFSPPQALTKIVDKLSTKLSNSLSRSK